MKRIIVLFLLTVLITSCNPMLHVGGHVMRKHNTSHNKYGPNKPYVGPQKHPHKQKHPRRERFKFWLWRNL